MTTASDLLARASPEKGDHAPFPAAPEASRYPGLTDTGRESPVGARCRSGGGAERRGPARSLAACCATCTRRTPVMRIRACVCLFVHHARSVQIINPATRRFFAAEGRDDVPMSLPVGGKTVQRARLNSCYLIYKKKNKIERIGARVDLWPPRKKRNLYKFNRNIRRLRPMSGAARRGQLIFTASLLANEDFNIRAFSLSK